MAGIRAASSMYDPRRGDQAFRIGPFRIDGRPSEPARTNRFGVYRIGSGGGSVAVDSAFHRFDAPSLIFAVPYQHVRFAPDGPVAGDLIEFHANFLCVETFHAEVGCAGALFNDPHGVPVMPMDPDPAADVADLFARMRREEQERGLAHEEALLAYLKILLVVATRLKTRTDAGCRSGASADRHPVVARLRELIEEHYRDWHSPSCYADALHVTPKTLGRTVREHLGVTPTHLIRARLLTHAKWQLLHTLRPVKEIALEVGFRDELYFSRVFKKAVGLSPTDFREFETAIRGGSNLSMTSASASIPPAPASADNASEGSHGSGDREVAAPVPRARKSRR